MISNSKLTVMVTKLMAIYGDIFTIKLGFIYVVLVSMPKVDFKK